MDENLGQLLTKELEGRFKDNVPKVTLVPYYKVKSFLNRNAATWRTMKASKLGESLGADFVVTLQINHMTLFNRGRQAQIYQGKAEIYIKVTETDKPEGENVPWDQEFECTYPKERFIDLSDMGPVQFRAKFLDRISREVARNFAPYEPRDKYDSD